MKSTHIYVVRRPSGELTAQRYEELGTDEPTPYATMDDLIAHMRRAGLPVATFETDVYDALLAAGINVTLLD